MFGLIETWKIICLFSNSLLIQSLFLGLRNENGLARLYLTSGSEAFRTVKALYKDNVDYEREVPILVDCMRGLIIPTKENVPQDGVLPSPIPGLYPVCENQVMTMKFLDPKYADDFIFPARKLEGARDQPKVLGANEGPVIGFGPRTDRGRLGNAGHRMVNHYGGRGGFRGNNDFARGEAHSLFEGNIFQFKLIRCIILHCVFRISSNELVFSSPGGNSNFNSNSDSYSSNSSTSANHNSSDFAANTNSTPANRGGMSVFEQLSSRINQYQQQVLGEISRNANSTGTVLPNPFAEQFRYDYNSSNNSRQNSGDYQHRGGYNQNQQRGRNMGNHNSQGGNQYQQRNQGGGGGGQRYNNNFNNGGGNRYGSNNSGGNRFNNNRRNY